MGLTKEVFKAMRGRLHVVGHAGVGVHNVDLQAATKVGFLILASDCRCWVAHKVFFIMS